MSRDIKYEVTHRYSGVEIPETELQRLLAIASWKQTPEFDRPGRGAWHLLREPASLVNSPACKLKAAKLKGVGLYFPKLPDWYSGALSDRHTDDPVPPTTVAFEDGLSYPHFGITPDGEYTFAYSKASPTGGLLHERAFFEYRNAEILIDNGVPSIVPLAVIRYEDKYRFNDEPMGAVISLSPDTNPTRISEILYGDATERGKSTKADQFYDQVRVALGINGEPMTETTRLETITHLSRQVGKLIHDFSMSGLYRHSSDWINFQFDFERRQVFLTDLDSSRKLEELPTELRPLQVLRDLGTMIYRLVAKFGFPTVLDTFTLNNLLHYDPVSEMIMAYFHGTPEKLARQVSRTLMRYFIPHLFLLKKHRGAIRDEWSREQRKSYKMDHDLFYILAITSLYPLFCRSDLGRKYPSSLTPDQMLKKAESFLGERYEYFLYLLNQEATAL